MGVFSETFLQNNKPSGEGGGQQPQSTTGVFAKQFGVSEKLQYKPVVPKPVSPVTLDQPQQSQSEDLLGKIQNFISGLMSKPEAPTAPQIPDNQLTTSGVTKNNFSGFTIALDDEGNVVEPNEVNLPIRAEFHQGTVKEENLWGKIKNFLSKPFKASDEELNARAGVSVAVRDAVAKKYNVPAEKIDLNEVQNNLDAYTKDLGVRAELNNSEFTELMFTLSAPYLLASGVPLVSLAKGFGKFLLYGTAIDAGISTITGKPMGEGLKSFLPEDSSQATKDVVELIDLAGKAWVTHKMSSVEPKIADFLTKQKFTEYGVPQTVTIDAAKVSSIFQTGDKISPYEEMLIKDLQNRGVKVDWKTAVKEGIKIEVPTKDIVTITDRPYWAKLKQTIGLPVSEPVTKVIDRQTNVKYGVPIAPKLLPEKTALPQDFEPPITKPTQVLRVEENKPIYRGIDASLETALQKGLGTTHGTFGKVVYFTDNPTSAKEFGDNLIEIPSGDLKWKTFKSLAEQQDFVEKMGVNNLSEAINKEGIYDGFYVPDIGEGGNNYVVTNIDKLTSLVSKTPAPAEAVPVKTKDIATVEKEISDIITQNKDAVDKAMGEIWAELEVAEAGQRITFEQPDTMDLGVIGIKSTFPSWVPEELRSRELFDKVMEGIVNIEDIRYPNKNRTAQRALYDAILEELDSRVGIDTSKQRSDILDLYGKQTAKPKVAKPKKPVRKSPTGSKEPVRKPQETKVERPEHIQRGIEKAKKLTEREVTVSGRKEADIKGFNPKNLQDPASPEAIKEADKIIKRSEIAKELSEKLGVPIRQGKFRTPGALGIYKTRPKIVRIKSGGLQTIFHEVGHFLDDKFSFSKNISISERKALMAEYGHAYENQPKRQQEEAFAEFLRFKMTGQTGKVSKMAPSFSKEFENKLEELPEIKDVIDTATRDFKRWNEQPATAKVLSNISTGAQEKEGLLNKINNTLHDIYTAGVDDLHPLSEFSKLAKRTLSGLPAEKDPYILARNLRGWVGKAELFLTKGTFSKNYWEVDGNKVKMNFTGKSYSDIMKPIEKAKMLDEFRAYIVSERALELNTRGIKTGISPEDAKAVIKELDAKSEMFKKVSEERRAYKDALLQYARDSGLIGTEGYKKIKELNKFHVPFYRVMEETYSGFMGGKKITGNVSSPIKKIKGSERDIIDPLESDVKDTYAIINASERNNIAIAMANLASQHYELGRLFEEISAPMQMTKVTGEEMVKNIYKALNIETSMPGRPFTDEEETALAEAVFNVFRPSYAKGVNMLNVNMGDQRKVFQVDPDLFKAIQGLNSEDVGIIMKVVSMPAKLLRAGATLSPDFTVRNPLRDQFTAMVYSNYGFVPGIDLIRGTFELFKKGDVYNLWKASGGEHSMLVSMDRDYLQKNFKDILKSKGAQALDYVKNPIELLRTLSEIGEQGTRLGEMKRGLEALAKRKATSPTEVAYSTREVTLDFARIGAKTKAVNLLVSFWNSNVQGTDRMIRAFKEKPFKTLFKVLMGITLPSILLYLANRDDERWDEIPGWQKDLFWIVLTPNHIIRIPKPFELGVLFGSVPERILEFMDKKDPKMLEELKNSVANGATPGFIPTTLLPIIENISNYSFFLDRPIVPQGKEDLPPEAQYGAYTSEVAKLIGKALEYSPSKVDNLIQGYAGGLGKYGVNVIDGVLKGTGITYEPVEPAKSIEDLPVIKAFMIKPPTGSSSESVNRVYEMYGETTGQLRYIKKLIEQGNTEDATAFAKKNRDVVYAPLLQSTIATFSDINKAKDEVRNSTTLSAEKKRDKIKKLDDAQLKIAQELLKQIKEDKKEE